MNFLIILYININFDIDLQNNIYYNNDGNEMVENE